MANYQSLRLICSLLLLFALLLPLQHEAGAQAPNEIPFDQYDSTGKLRAKKLPADAAAFRAAAGVPSTTGSTSITTLGTITTGTWQGTPIGAAYLPSRVTQLAQLADPDADRILFWDDSAGSGGALAWLAPGNGITISGTTIAANFGTTSTTVSSGDRGLPSGGTTNQVLRKTSGTNYAVEWATPASPFDAGSGSSLSIAPTGSQTSINYYSRPKGSGEVGWRSGNDMWWGIGWDDGAFIGRPSDSVGYEVSAEGLQVKAAEDTHINFVLSGTGEVRINGTALSSIYQAQSTLLTNLSALTGASGSYVRFTGTNTMEVRSAAQTLADLFTAPGSNTSITVSPSGSASNIALYFRPKGAASMILNAGNDDIASLKLNASSASLSYDVGSFYVGPTGISITDTTSGETILQERELFDAGGSSSVDFGNRELNEELGPAWSVDGEPIVTEGLEVEVYGEDIFVKVKRLNSSTASGIQYVMLKVWFSATAYGAPITVTELASLTPEYGATLYYTGTSDSVAVVCAGAEDGVANLTCSSSGTADVYINVAYGTEVVSKYISFP